MNNYIKFKQLNSAVLVEPKIAEKYQEKTGSIYESLSVIAKRSNQIQISLKEEFSEKKEDFSSLADNIEEIQENKELIEISRAYEKLPSPVNLAISEFEQDKIFFRRNEEKKDSLFS